VTKELDLSDEDLRLPAKVRILGSTAVGIDRDIAHRIVEAHVPELEACLHEARGRHPTIFGRVSLRWDVGEDGKPDGIRVVEASVDDTALIDCILANVATWKFPTAEGRVNITSEILLE